MKIPNDRIPLVYQVSKKVYEKKLTRKEGVKKNVGENQMNPASAQDYITNFSHLVNGKKFTRTLNTWSMTYFFEQIHEDYGATGITNALSALMQHIEYYERSQNVSMHSMRAIYAKYSELQNNSPDVQEQNEIIQEIKTKNSRSEILEELKSLTPSTPERIAISGKAYKRDNKTIAQLKILRGFKCQMCSTTILKKDGSFYAEAAHIEPKSRKGPETPENIIILCPNHHKEFDLGDREIINHTPNEIHFKLNNSEYKIELALK